MRLSTAFWASAYIKSCQSEGDFAALVRHGADHGGALFISILKRGGFADLYGPAPQSHAAGDDRSFIKVLSDADPFEVQEYLEKEARFDGDFWVIERENADGTHGLEVVEID